MRSFTYRVGFDLTGRKALTLAQELARIPIADLDALILTLKDVENIDASGLAVLVRLYSHLTRSHKFLILRDFSPEVEAVLRRVGLESVLVEAEEPSALGDPLRHRPWSPADSRLPSRSDPGRREKVPSIDDLVDALAKLDSSQAMSFLSRVQAKLGLTPVDPHPVVPAAQPVPEASAEPPAKAHESQEQLRSVQGEIFRTGKRKKMTFDGQRIVEPTRTASGDYAAAEDSAPAHAADPSPTEMLPNDVESLLLDYLGHSEQRRRAALQAPSSNGGAKATPQRVPALDPIRASLPANGPPTPEPKKPDVLPAGIRALLSDYLSHEDSSTLGPWASASGVG